MTSLGVTPSAVCHLTVASGSSKQYFPSNVPRLSISVDEVYSCPCSFASSQISFVQPKRASFIESHSLPVGAQAVFPVNVPVTVGAHTSPVTEALPPPSIVPHENSADLNGSIGTAALILATIDLLSIFF